MYLNLTSLNTFERVSALHLKVNDVNSMVTEKLLNNDNAKTANTVNPTTELSGKEMGVDIGRVGSWATDFEKLLSDPVGLRTFTVSVYHIAD